MNLIQKFQEIIKEKQMNAYIIPTNDYHNSEYVSDFFKARQFLTGFDGSAGTLVITQNEALLWVDGRYHIQAEKQVENKPIKIMKQGLEGVISINQYLKNTLKQGDVLGFDGKILSTSYVNNIIKLIPDISIKYDQDLVNLIWENRPQLPQAMIYQYDEFFAGKDFKSKFNDILIKMNEQNCDTHIITSLEDQAWLYNLRGDDVSHTPVFLANTIIIDNQCHLFIDNEKIDKVIEKYLRDCNIIVHEYFEFYSYIKEIENKTILLDFNKVNYITYSSLKDKNKLIDSVDPSLLMKAIKNETEIANTKLAHIKDGVAFTKLMYYVKNNINKEVLTEMSVSDLLETYRREQEGIVDLSFNTICAYKEHGAMMHYSATPESNSTLSNEGFLLIDSGGHYLEGTTDITRTLALGELTPTMKLHFTTVLKSVIALSEAVFLKGCRGVNLDILARGPIWKLLIDYKCGTGHGVGHLLSVHEAPNGFRWQIVPERNDSAILQEGMITTNEPGIYLENQYGIRIENELLCVNKGHNEFGEFLGFETITYAPIDVDAIDYSLLNEEEKQWLKNYHEIVYNTLSPHLNDEEKTWLKSYIK